MNDDADRRRRSIRLPAYDYAQPGAYFVTVTAFGRRCLFGDVVRDAMQLSDIGRIATDEWHETAALRPNIELDAFVVMPNHVHAILWLLDDALFASDEGTARRAPTDREPARFGKPVANSLSTIIGAHKSAVTKRVRREIGPANLEIWQRGYYERVIRSEAELLGIREYITTNPRLWAEDEENPWRNT